MSNSINHLATADGLFFGKGGLDQRKTAKMVDDALAGTDDGELFLEYVQSESLSFDDGKLKSASFDTSQGFGLRAVAGDVTGFAHASALDEQALKRAAETVKTVRAGRGGKSDESPRGTNHLLYADDNPIDGVPFAQKVALMQEIDAYVRAKEPKARQVSVSLSGSWQVVEIVRAGGWRAADVRPLVRLNVSVVCADGSRMEAGSTGSGPRRAAYGDIFLPGYWQKEADEAIRQALVNLDSIDAPAGEMTVVLGPGWPGILLHEAIGHGLEGDFNRKGSSPSAGASASAWRPRASRCWTTAPCRSPRLAQRRRRRHASQRNVLIEDGILKGYMQDAMNARLMGVKPTGNGRRESYAHMPMPRMTNTYMLGGDKDPKEIVASIKKGLYATNFGGGQVDITSASSSFQLPPRPTGSKTARSAVPGEGRHPDRRRPGPR
jgi:TldD protein